MEGGVEVRMGVDRANRTGLWGTGEPREGSEQGRGSICSGALWKVDRSGGYWRLGTQGRARALGTQKRE